MPSLPKNIIVGVCLLIWTKVCSSQDFIIERRDSTDYFTIPPSMCDQRNHNLCTKYNAQLDKKCDCFCGGHNATFSFHSQSWSCRNARSIFGCRQGMFFEDENSADSLRILKRKSPEELLLGLTWKGNCTANASSSWYIGCQGNKENFTPTQKAFKIEWDSSESEYTLKLNIPSDNPPVGRVVNLGITCAMPDSTTEHSCLLFKIEGTTNCPVTVPVTTPHTSKGMTTIIDEAKAGPSSAADQHGDDFSFPSSVVLTAAGIGASLFVILIIGFFIYRWKYSRNQSHTRHAGQTGHTSHAGQTGHTSHTSQIGQTGLQQSGENNAGYATLGCNGSVTYASNYKVPNDVQNDASLNVVDMRASNTENTDHTYEYIPTDGYQKETPLRGVEQPEYNLIEVLNTENTDGSYEYIPTEGYQKAVPLDGEEKPEYNFIEVLNTDTSDRSYEYVPSEENQKDAPLGSFDNHEYNLIEDFDTASTDEKHEDPAITENAPFSVEQRAYNMIEDLDTGTFQDPMDDNPREPVYNVLEQSSLNSAGNNADCYGNSDEQSPVYNVLCRGPFDQE